MFNQESDGGTISPATETVIKLFYGTDGETGRFFSMKRAQTEKVCTRLFQLNVIADHLDDINPVQQILYE